MHRGSSPLRVLGVITEDFEVYHDLVAALKDRDIPFASLSARDAVPPNVGVLVTTSGEAPRLSARWPGPIVVFTEPRETIDAALRALAGRRLYRRVVVGVDPGEKPGVAVIGDGELVGAVQVRVPEQVADEVRRARHQLAAESFVVRVGHGAPTFRDRILLVLQGLADEGVDVRVEVVDETASTPSTYKTAEERDTHAAHAIALARGVAAATIDRVRPSEGELRDIQRKSRVASAGRVTVSRRLARRVATGEMTLEEAIRTQEGR